MSQFENYITKCGLMGNKMIQLTSNNKKQA